MQDFDVDADQLRKQILTIKEAIFDRGKLLTLYQEKCNQVQAIRKELIDDAATQQRLISELKNSQSLQPKLTHAEETIQQLQEDKRQLTSLLEQQQNATAASQKYAEQLRLVITENESARFNLKSESSNLKNNIDKWKVEDKKNKEKIEKYASKIEYLTKFNKVLKEEKQQQAKKIKELEKELSRLEKSSANYNNNSSRKRQHKRNSVSVTKCHKLGSPNLVNDKVSDVPEPEIGDFTSSDSDSSAESRIEKALADPSQQYSGEQTLNSPCKSNKEEGEISDATEDGSQSGLVEGQNHHIEYDNNEIDMDNDLASFDQTKSIEFPIRKDSPKYIANQESEQHDIKQDSEPCTVRHNHRKLLTDTKHSRRQKLTRSCKPVAKLPSANQIIDSLPNQITDTSSSAAGVDIIDKNKKDQTNDQNTKLVGDHGLKRKRVDKTAIDKSPSKIFSNTNIIADATPPVPLAYHKNENYTDILMKVQEEIDTIDNLALSPLSFNSDREDDRTARVLQDFSEFCSVILDDTISPISSSSNEEYQDGNRANLDACSNKDHAQQTSKIHGNFNVDATNTIDTDDTCISKENANDIDKGTNVTKVAKFIGVCQQSRNSSESSESDKPNRTKPALPNENEQINKTPQQRKKNLKNTRYNTRQRTRYKDTDNVVKSSSHRSTRMNIKSNKRQVISCKDHESSDSEDDFQPKYWNDLFLALYSNRVSVSAITERMIHDNVSTTRMVYVLLSNLPSLLDSKTDSELDPLEHLINDDYSKSILCAQENRFVDAVIKLESKYKPDSSFLSQFLHIISSSAFSQNDECNQLQLSKCRLMVDICKRLGLAKPIIDFLTKIVNEGHKCNRIYLQQVFLTVFIVWPDCLKEDLHVRNEHPYLWKDLFDPQLATIEIILIYLISCTGNFTIQVKEKLHNHRDLIILVVMKFLDLLNDLNFGSSNALTGKIGKQWIHDNATTVDKIAELLISLLLEVELSKGLFLAYLQDTIRNYFQNVCMP
ncbi:uncharacterized protein TRIADDRAFT_54498 [Trichoplax adhaerens]|uniref:Uncharacterized protein n=1 Tax=Trichoplax adhaerens TaxID=10228 RepID=B3RS75_TRIAD|nr:predicted protein [Trichoplax adhaerens]EDV26467.1 predicted protein [Trichoplax adhaerens]|eukprot:XP_002110463.1 predicted protein [Trichoplax adhaerens]